MPNTDVYINVCIFIIISYAMRYPIKSILLSRKQSARGKHQKSTD